jgi:hypothetical protein
LQFFCKVLKHSQNQFTGDKGGVGLAG